MIDSRTRQAVGQPAPDMPRQGAPKKEKKRGSRSVAGRFSPDFVLGPCFCVLFLEAPWNRGGGPLVLNSEMGVLWAGLCAIYLGAKFSEPPALHYLLLGTLPPGCI
jgi:hypothetical protein